MFMRIQARGNIYAGMGKRRRRERDAECREGGVQGGDAPSLLGIWDRRELPQRDPGSKTRRKTNLTYVMPVGRPLVAKIPQIL